MAEYGKQVLGEATKGATAAIVGALLLLFGQQWLTSDLEFKVSARDAYLSAPLGRQGLAMSFGGKPLNNVSVVEFSVINRTGKQFANADIVFTVDGKSAPALVAAGVLPPQGMSPAETVEEISSKDPAARKFRLKVVPKQRGSEYFDAIFVFDGEQAPSMSVSSGSGDVSIVPYQQWKDKVTEFLFILGLVLSVGAAQVLAMSFIDYFLEPRKHNKQVQRFVAHAAQMSKGGNLESTDPASQVDAAAIYASFTRPKPSRFWSKILPDQRFEY